jgi:hypothetical protein
MNGRIITLIVGFLSIAMSGGTSFAERPCPDLEQIEKERKAWIAEQCDLHRLNNGSCYVSTGSVQQHDKEQLEIWKIYHPYGCK